MWRWSFKNYFWHSNEFVFSTHVEVILRNGKWLKRIEGILHTCGGDPYITLINFTIKEYSPHMWRWSYAVIFPLSFSGVFSTHVEVILMQTAGQPLEESILHTCGGDPFFACLTLCGVGYSPHMWRWSFIAVDQIELVIVFSTHVEVILYILPQETS